MATQIVMDRSGDIRSRFDSSDAMEVAQAAKRFMELTDAGFTAAVRTAKGDCRVVKSSIRLLKKPYSIHA